MRGDDTVFQEFAGFTGDKTFPHMGFFLLRHCAADLSV